MKKENSLKAYSLDQIEDEVIGVKGTPGRDQYEYELKLDILGKMIKHARKERNMTQEELGKLIGVQKATISKLERYGKNVTIDTILRVFTALKAKVKFKIELDKDNKLEIA